MPLIQQGSFDRLEWCLWTASVNEVDSENIHRGFLQRERLNAISNAEVRAQYLGARMALQSLVGQNGILSFSSNGKPQYSLPGSVSLSHTVGRAAACYHPEHSCGIDVEHSNRSFSHRIIQRFAHPDEMHQVARYGAVHLWCAKEAVYKANGTSGIQFSEHIRVEWQEDVDGVLSGVATTHNKKIWILQNRLIDGVVVSVTIPNVI